MVFLVLPALVPDISEVYDVYFAAFKDNAVTKALFPMATTEDMADSNSKLGMPLRCQLRHNHTALYLY